MRKRPPSVAVFVVPILALVVCGCAKHTQRSDGHDAQAIRPSPAPSNPISVTGTDWVLTRIGNDPALPREITGRPWFHLDGGAKRRVTGNTGVNLISGTYELSGGALQFGPLITTRRAAAPQLMQQESRLLKAFESTATADLHGQTLTLRDAGGGARAEFEAMQVTQR